MRSTCENEHKLQINKHHWRLDMFLHVGTEQNDINH
jgi:hypothetical protein